MYKIDKYIDKLLHNNEKSKYVKKLAEKIIDNLYMSMHGGGNGIIDGNLKSLFDYIDKKIQNKTQTSTKNKYMVILYGPPSSGKNIARKIACNKIKINFDEQITEKEIFDTFIDSGVDEIIIEYKENSTDTTVFDKLKEAYKKKASIKTPDETDNDFIKKNIVDIASESFRIYGKHKIKSDAVSEMVKFLSVFLNMNLFIETASWYGEYWNNFLNVMSYYKYIPLVIYPFTTHSELLYDRSISRGISEYRFLQHDGNFGIKSMAEKAKNNFKNVVKDIKSIYVEDTYILVYNTELEQKVFANINNFIFLDPIEEIYSLKTIKSGNINFTNNIITN